MRQSYNINKNGRYSNVTKEKANGATYTPRILSDFVANKIIEKFGQSEIIEPIRIFDPAVGDGILLESLLSILTEKNIQNIEVYGFETNDSALLNAKSRLKKLFPRAVIKLELCNFLEFVLDNYGADRQLDLFNTVDIEKYDLIIANPPYVRTQIMGSMNSQELSKKFGLSGRIDLYYAFLIGIAQVLKPKGIAGIIISNRFMTIKSGGAVRKAILQQFKVLHIWDMGDTKLFDAAVLPAVLLVEGRNNISQDLPNFTSIYQTQDQPGLRASNQIDALSKEGIIEIDDGRKFYVQHGKLNNGGTDSGVWRITTDTSNSWSETVKAHTWCTLGEIGKIHVGVKTCADKVFIRSDWQTMDVNLLPELLKPLTTHHIARRFKAVDLTSPYQILYTHEIVEEKRQAVDLNKYPRSKAYLEKHRETLEGRKYVIEAGRKWYEIWVPQDPAEWNGPKLVFRDIADKPIFWIDQNNTIVNGDCYWMTCGRAEGIDLLWLTVAVCNSMFIEEFYDHCFHNKLYAGRRRFITQYVEQFPLPDPVNEISKMIIAMAKEIYNSIDTPKAKILAAEIDSLVWHAFGLPVKEISR